MTISTGSNDASFVLFLQTGMPSILYLSQNHILVPWVKLYPAKIKALFQISVVPSVVWLTLTITVFHLLECVPVFVGEAALLCFFKCIFKFDIGSALLPPVRTRHLFFWLVRIHSYGRVVGQNLRFEHMYCAMQLRRSSEEVFARLAKNYNGFTYHVPFLN